MSSRFRVARKDALAWAASAVFVLAAAGLYAAAAQAPSPAPSSSFSSSDASAPQALHLATTPPQILDAPADPRLLAFKLRVASVRPFEAAVSSAFRGPPAMAPAPVSRPLRIARVAPARTAQACLAQAVYYEARGEPAEGQAAVAQVVLNRTRSGRHPSDVCGAVFEGAARPGCQFSFACDPRLAHRRLEPGAWLRAQGVAAEILAGRGPAELRTALNYHADYVRPRWATQLQRTAEIGRHIFYASASAATRALAGWTFTAPAPPPAGA